MANDKELLPCPFCGREELRFNGEYHVNYRSHVIECDCSVKMYGQDLISLRKQWNTRNSEHFKAKCVEAAKKCKVNVKQASSGACAYAYNEGVDSLLKAIG